MKFFKRLKYFAVGFSLGILFVYFLFKDRDFKWDWLPGNRVSNFILDHPIKIDESRLGEIIDKEDFSRSVYNAIIEGEVDFSNSKTKSELKTYIIENELDKLHILVSFTDSVSKIIQFNNNIYFNENSIESNLINLNIDSTNFFKRINDWGDIAWIIINNCDVHLAYNEPLVDGMLFLFLGSISNAALNDLAKPL